MIETTKLAFFDIDGTLCAPRFINDHNEIVTGFTKKKWIEYCIKHGESAYQNCKPVKQIFKLAERLHDNGYAVFALSTAEPEEHEAKIRFVREHGGKSFIDCLFVKKDDEKVTTIKDTAKKYGCKVTDCVFVDDTYDIVLDALKSGIKAMHVSNVIVDAE